MRMDPAQRHAAIARRLTEVDAVTVAELAAAYSASEATIRRDLVKLDQQGLVRRTHGGARRLHLRAAEVEFAARSNHNPDAKRRIAHAVADLLAPDESVLLDSGTTSLEVAHAIAGARLRVMPLSLRSAAVLADSPSIALTLPAGDVRFHEQALVGPMTQESIGRLRFDTAVIAGCGFSLADGVTAYDVRDAAVKQAAVKVSERSILVCDASTWDTTAFAWVVDTRDLALIVTDHELTKAERSLAEQADVEVVTV
jgi:DeoR/GlpR family transcriptional regulator of sugar metabolism